MQIGTIWPLMKRTFGTVETVEFRMYNTAKKPGEKGRYDFNLKISKLTYQKLFKLLNRYLSTLNNEQASNEQLNKARSSFGKMVAHTTCLGARYDSESFDDNLVANEFLFNHLFKENVPPVTIAKDEESRLLEVIHGEIKELVSPPVW